MLPILVAATLLAAAPEARQPAPDLVSVVTPAEARKARLKAQYQAELKRTVERRRDLAARKRAAREEMIAQRYLAIESARLASLASAKKKEEQQYCKACMGRCGKTCKEK